MSSSPRRLLWVDDDGPAPYFFETTTLSNQGWSVRWAENVTEAAEILAKEEFSAVILDHVLPLRSSPWPLSEETVLWGGCLLLYWLRGRELPGHIPAPHGFSELYASHPLEANRQVPIVVVSAYFSDEIQAAMRGAISPETELRSLTKPVDTEGLLMALEEVTGSPTRELSDS